MLLISCSGEKPTQQEFIGKWSSQNGKTQIYFFPNGTCSGVIEENYPVGFHKTIAPIVFDSVKWVLKKPYEDENEGRYDFRKKYRIELDPNIVPIDPLIILGSNTPFYNKPPWELVCQYGDLDALEYYVLIRNNSINVDISAQNKK